MFILSRQSNTLVRPFFVTYLTPQFLTRYHIFSKFESLKILKRARKLKNRFFFIAFFNSITIQKVNTNVLNRLDEKWKNERQKGWAPFAKIDGPQEIETYFIFVPFCSDCKKTEVQIGLKFFFLSQNMFFYLWKIQFPLLEQKILLQNVFFLLNCLFNYIIVYWNFSIRK